MSTAILISGHMRSFDRCLPNLAWMVFRHFPGADFFVSTEPDEDAAKAELLRQRFPQARVEIDTTPQPPMVIPSREPWAHSPYAISVPPAAVLGQLWRLEQCWSAHAIDGYYDIIIRCRPDLWFHSAEGLDADLDRHGARVPWWGRFGGVNDRFAILSGYGARAYFTTFGQTPDHLRAGCPLHPESLVRASLDAAGADIDDSLRVEFSTLRKDGTFRQPEITAIDIAHLRSAA